MDSRLKTIYEDRAVPLAQLSEMNGRMLDNAMALRGAFMRNALGKPAVDLRERISNNSERIVKLLGDYMATYLTPEEKILADSFVASPQGLCRTGRAAGRGSAGGWQIQRARRTVARQGVRRCSMRRGAISTS